MTKKKHTFFVSSLVSGKNKQKHNMQDTLPTNVLTACLITKRDLIIQDTPQVRTGTIREV